MAVYRILVKKEVRGYAWTNTYVVVTQAAHTRNEQLMIADTVAPRFVTFERVFHSEEVQFTDTITTPLLDPPATNVFTQRGAGPGGALHSHVAGQRPIGLAASAGPQLTLVLGLEPVRNHWGSKDYRYALSLDDLQATPRGYQFRPDASTAMQQRLARAKRELGPLLGATAAMPALAISATTQIHDPQTYGYRYVQDMIIKGIHLSKHRRR